MRYSISYSCLWQGQWASQMERYVEGCETLPWIKNHQIMTFLAPGFSSSDLNGFLHFQTSLSFAWKDKNVFLIPDNHLSFMYISGCWYKPGSKCLSYFPGIENVIVDSAAPDKEIRKYHCSAHGCRVAVQPCSCVAVYVTVGLKQNVWLAKWCYHTQAVSCRNNTGFTLSQNVV